MDNETTNQTTDNTSIEQPVNNSTPVDNTQTTNEDTTIPTTGDTNAPTNNTTPEPTNIEPTTSTPIETSPSDGTTAPIQSSVENPVTNDNTNENTTTIPVTPIEIPNYIEVYDYDANGYYIGTDIADRSPLDKEVVYLLPANATKIKPPEITLGKIQKWNGVSWDIVDRPNNVVINDETNKNTNEVISSLQAKVTELETKIDKLEKLMTGVIVSKLNVSAKTTTTL